MNRYIEVTSQEDYNYLMNKLEKENFVWNNGEKPTSCNYFKLSQDGLNIIIEGRRIYWSDIKTLKEYYENKEVEKYSRKTTNKVYY